MDNEDVKFFTMRISVDFMRKIKSYCALNEITMRQFSTDALVHYLNYQENEEKEIEKQIERFKVREMKNEN